MQPAAGLPCLSDAPHYADPYPAYARMRREAPVSFVEDWGGWAVTRYADVAAGFRDPRLSASRAGGFAARLPPEVRERLAPLTTNLSSWALLVDPPAHTRLRGLINTAFTPRVVERLRPAVAEITGALLDEALRGGDGELDVVAALANPLPVIVIGDLLGLPRGDRRRLKAWSDALAAAMGAARPSLEIAVAASDAVVEMEAYFRDVLSERRRAPSDDLLSQLVSACEDGKLLDDQELVSTCSMLLFGGHETTTNLIANGLLALLRHPDQIDRLRAASAGEAWPRAVDELLRFDSPVQRMSRVAREDLDLGGQRVPAGARVYLVMGAAHRDEEAFPSPDRLDVARTPNRHLAFGLGAHYCVGAALGHVESEIALRELLLRAPRIELAEAEPPWMPNATIRGLERLRVRIATA